MKNQIDEHLPREGKGRDEMIQLYAWTFEEACSKQEAWKEKGENGRGPLFRWLGAADLKELCELYRKGNKAALIKALEVCALNSLPLPRWCEMAYLSAYREICQYEARSWDDVFGRPHPKGTHLETKREIFLKSDSVYDRINEILKTEPNIPIDKYLFERVGCEFGIGGATKISEIYYKIKKELNQLIQ